MSEPNIITFKSTNKGTGTQLTVAFDVKNSIEEFVAAYGEEAAFHCLILGTKGQLRSKVNAACTATDSNGDLTNSDEDIMAIAKAYTPGAYTPVSKLSDTDRYLKALAKLPPEEQQADLERLMQKLKEQRAQG